MDDVKTDDRQSLGQSFRDLVDAQDQELAPRQAELSSRAAEPRNVTAIESRPKLSLLEHSDEIGELLKALVAATLNFDEIEKDLTAKVQPRDPNKRAYEYDYASLFNINSKVRKPLAQQGLVIMHGARPTNSGVIVIRTTLWHVSGQWVRNDLLVGTGPTMDPQIIGTGMSYAKRYNILALLNLSPMNEDDDGAMASLAVQAAQEAQAPRPAQRKSQQAAVPASHAPKEKSSVSDRLKDAATKKPIGKIAEFAMKKDVGYVALDTGYLAATRDANWIHLLKMAKEKEITIEIVTEVKEGYAPTIVEIIAKDLE